MTELERLQAEAAHLAAISCADPRNDERGHTFCGKDVEIERLNRAISDSQSAEAEYEVILIDEDGSEEWASGTAGPREEALAGARHYAIQHAKDGPVKIVEVTRRVIERLSPLPKAPR